MTDEVSTPAHDDVPDRVRSTRYAGNIEDAELCENAATEGGPFGPFLCTRPEDHDGDHVAHGTGSSVVEELNDEGEVSIVAWWSR